VFKPSSRIQSAAANKQLQYADDLKQQMELEKNRKAQLKREVL